MKKVGEGGTMQGSEEIIYEYGKKRDKRNEKRNRHRWYEKEKISRLLNETIVMTERESEFKVPFALTREYTKDDIVCIDTRTYISHIIKFERSVMIPPHITNTDSIRQMVLDERKSHDVVFKKMKMSTLLYGAFPLERLKPYFQFKKSMSTGKIGTRIKRMLVGIANPVNHGGAIAFAIPKYQMIYYPAPIDDFGIFVGDIEVVGWGYVPSRNEVFTAVGTCMRKIAEKNDMRYIGVASFLVNSGSLVPAPVSQAEEVALVSAKLKNRKIHIYVWPTTSFPQKDVELFVVW